MPRKAGCHRRPSDKVPSLPGQLVHHAVPPERAGIPRDSGSNPRALGLKHRWPGQLGPHRHRSRAGVYRDSVSIPRDFGPERECPWTAG